ncbi:MAG TPA: hypothetical protein VGI85_15365 [Chthoniobacterales bacterium]
MLRITSLVSIVTWTTLGVGSALALRQFGTAIFGVFAVISVLATIPAVVMLVRNHPFLLGPTLFVSVLGLLPGFWGVALLFYCIGSASGSSIVATKPIEWLLAIGLVLMFVPPINWAILWRDYRHDIALNI